MQPKWTVLSEALKATGKYYPDRLAPKLLRGRYYARCAVTRETTSVIGGRPIIQAYAALWPTNDLKELELGTVYIRKDLRGNGLRDELMAEAISLAPTGTKLFLMTDIEAIMRSVERLGFRSVTTETQPELLIWAGKVGIVTRLPGSIHPITPGTWGTPKAGERWLYWR